MSTLSIAGNNNHIHTKYGHDKIEIVGISINTSTVDMMGDVADAISTISGDRNKISLHFGNDKI